MNLANCQIFTPYNTVKFMLDQIGYTENIYGKKIIDNSCGSGNFLIEIVRRFINDGLKQNKSNSQIKKALAICVKGCEYDEKYVIECKDNLSKIAGEFNLSNVEWNVVKEDGLYIDEDGAYDYVVGNPPYISYFDLDVEIRQKTKEDFVSCVIGKYDYSYAFIEKGLRLLNKEGKMVYITPSNMFKATFGEKLRQIIRSKLIQITDCSELKPFDKVLTSPAITIYQNNLAADVVIYQELHINGAITERVIDKNLLDGKWDFTGYHSAGRRRFGDRFKASNSIATLLNNAFIYEVKKDGTMEIDIETSIFREAKSPRSERYGVVQKIIFPYTYDNGELQKYTENEFHQLYPKAYQFLLTRKEDLLKRDSDNSAQWFEYGRSQALMHLDCDKLLISSIITKEVVVYKLDRETIPYSGIYIISKDATPIDSAILILKSKNFYRYLLSKGIKINGQSIRISSKDIEEYMY